MARTVSVHPMLKGPAPNWLVEARIWNLESLEPPKSLKYTPYVPLFEERQVLSPDCEAVFSGGTVSLSTKKASFSVSLEPAVSNTTTEIKLDVSGKRAFHTASGSAHGEEYE